MRLYAYIAAGIAFFALIAAIILHAQSDARTRSERDSLRTWQADAVDAVKVAADNPGVTKETAVGQIVALGESNRTLKFSIETQNERIDELAREAVAARAKAAELKKIADRAEAQRASALKRLSDMGATPGTRDDCLTLLREAEEALDLVREAGL